MGIEDVPPPEPSAPELLSPEPESFTPIESVHELEPQIGSTFDVLKKDGETISESGTILGVFDDDRYAGGGYFQVELTKASNPEKQLSGKLPYQQFLEFYNGERVLNFTNPEQEDAGTAVTTPETPQPIAVRSETSESLQSPESQLDPQFASYLRQFIQVKGAENVSQFLATLDEAGRKQLQKELVKNNLHGFIYKMELFFDNSRATPESIEKHKRMVLDSVSDDPQTRERASSELGKYHMAQLGKLVTITGRHLRPKTEEEARLQKEAESLMAKWLGKGKPPRA